MTRFRIRERLPKNRDEQLNTKNVRDVRDLIRVTREYRRMSFGGRAINLSAYMSLLDESSYDNLNSLLNYMRSDGYPTPMQTLVANAMRGKPNPDRYIKD